MVFVETTDSSGAFNRLFDYISGDNSNDQKIPMTAPVFMYFNEKDVEVMAFVMPADMSFGETPKPDNSSVDVKLTEDSRFATFKYFGCNNDSMEQDGINKLKDWLATSSYVYDKNQQATYAGYSAPFIPCMLRHNEVMFRLTVQ